MITAAQGVVAVGAGLAVILTVGGLVLCGTSLFDGKTEDFAFRRQWGGFGGGSTGWLISPRLLRYVAGLVALCLGVGLIALVLQLPAGAPATGAAAPTAQAPMPGHASTN